MTGKGKGRLCILQQGRDVTVTKSAKRSCDYGSIFTITNEGLYPGTGEDEDSENFTRTAMKMEMVLFMSLQIIYLHKTAEKSTCVDCFLQQG